MLAKQITKIMASKRFYFPDLGAYYNDCLQIEAALKNQSIPVEAASLLRAKLMERREFRKEMVQYAADRHGVSFQEMWNLMLNGGYIPTTEEIQAMEDKQNT